MASESDVKTMQNVKDQRSGVELCQTNKWVVGTWEFFRKRTKTKRYSLVVRVTFLVLPDL
ncbi:hypothetical protein PanWU01x14_228930 [Parasponia andersonii]|uniref:Uncharacterized protein n=1 Tax=Parasponia andersonii TaxID=3476 RepID=A0A2P5BLA8_PARAD|nr:hypothetical protein PanWU01x14_228930 [Parasponia andersonii]